MADKTNIVESVCLLSLHRSISETVIAMSQIAIIIWAPNKKIICNVKTTAYTLILLVIFYA